MNHFKEFMVTSLTAFGITTVFDQFIAGLLLSLAATYLMAVWFPEKDKMELWKRLLASFLLATLIAMTTTWFLPTVIVQVKMFLAGFVSAPLINMIGRVSTRIEDHSEAIADKITHLNGVEIEDK